MQPRAAGGEEGTREENESMMTARSGVGNTHPPHGHAGAAAADGSRGTTALAKMLEKEREEARWLRERVLALEKLAMTLSPGSLESLDSATSLAGGRAQAAPPPAATQRPLIRGASGTTIHIASTLVSRDDAAHTPVQCRLNFSDLHCVGPAELGEPPGRDRAASASANSHGRGGGAAPPANITPRQRVLDMVNGARPAAAGSGNGGGGPYGIVSPSKMVISSPHDRRAAADTLKAFALDPRATAPADADPVRNGDVRVIGCPPASYGVRSAGASIHKVVTPPSVLMESGARTRSSSQRGRTGSAGAGMATPLREDKQFVDYLKQHLSPPAKSPARKRSKSAAGGRGSDAAVHELCALLRSPNASRGGTDMSERVRKTLAPPPSPQSLERLSDAMMKELAKKMPFLPIRKVGFGTWTIDNPERKYKVAVHSGQLVVRVGSGYEDVVAFLLKKANTQSEMKIKARMLAASYDETY